MKISRHQKSRSSTEAIQRPTSLAGPGCSKELRAAVPGQVDVFVSTYRFSFLIRFSTMLTTFEWNSPQSRLGYVNHFILGGFLAGGCNE